jgi:arylsulfatase
MKKQTLLLLILTFFLFSCQEKKQQEPNRPNIIYILADDLGYNELGCYGQEKIETSNIDKLAETGMRFTQHYSGSPVCAPARCNLLTGLHPGHAFVRGNHEWGSRGKVWDYRAMINDSTLEGQYPMPDTTITIAKLLKQAGYATGMIGKWGLGAPHTNSIPNKMGFDYFCGYNCQRIAHTYYPVFLYENEHRLYLNNDTVQPHLRLEKGADSLDENSYSRFTLNEYAPDIMHTKALDFISDNKDNPFFLYYATPIPHLPLQAPKKWVDYYRNKFGDEDPLVRTWYYPNRYPRATYAAMISYLDQQVGELITKLKDLGIYDNTLIIFTSDNGPTYIDADTKWFESAKPFQTKTGRTKGHVYEGGIRVPMIASWPGIIKPGSETNHISAFWDVMPSLCDIAETDYPGYSDGISFLPVLKGEEQKQHDFLYWEFAGYGGQQAVRMGKWKAIRNNIRKGNLKIELYNLNEDMKEENDVSEQHPDIVRQIEEIMKKEHTASTLERCKLKALGDI